MPLIDANYTKLFVESFGDPALPPVLLIHGLFFSGKMYAAQLPLLTKHFYCVTLDLRSMGRSAPALGGHDVDNLCADALAVQDALNLGPVHWVGSSVGGVMGIRVAAQRPERVRSLVTCGASAHSEPAEKVARYDAMMADYVKDPAANWARTSRVLYASGFLEDPQRKAEVEAQRAAFLDNDHAANQRAGAPIFRRVNIEHLLPHVKCPTLAVVGEKDAANPPSESEVIVSGIGKRARLHVMPGVGHQPNAEAPQQLGEVILDFLRECEAAAA